MFFCGIDIGKSSHVASFIDSDGKIIKTFSGGQQARLLLAAALIQDPDLLLLDEPTNNLDKAGIAHLTEFLINYPKTCIVISHDEDFLNAFTEGVAGGFFKNCNLDNRTLSTTNKFSLYSSKTLL